MQESNNTQTCKGETEHMITVELHMSKNNLEELAYTLVEKVIGRAREEIASMSAEELLQFVGLLMPYA